jgi:dipeptidyl aminopeptidase/acylaminoacyl peptidase
VAFCQWDYAFLPAQARLFQRELKAKGNTSELLYIPGENHISEVIALVAESNATREALVRFIKRQESPSAGI